ncbi:M48 family metalloprotease [Allocoleopsis sp.]|uniref:M48 family metalloprotease n=1 Tax=Allocoleopsis sp. TaxID=3088169 RepID=UPI002FD1F178
MKILWNTLLISLGLLLPTSSSIVLSQSIKTAKFDTPTLRTSEFRPISNSATTVVNGDLPEASSAFEVIPPTLNETIEEPIAIASADTVIAEEASPPQAPPTIVVPVIPATTQETPSQTEVPEKPPTPTAPTPQNSPSDSEKPDQTEGADKKPSSSDSTDAKEPELSPEELARQQKLIQADQLFMSGQFAAAQQLYREAKKPFETEAQSEVKAQPEPIYDAAQLPAAGSVYWRMSGEGLEQKLETKIFVPLESLVEQFPEFIPGHLRYAQALKDYNQPEKALQVLERASTLYPKEPELLKVTIAAMGEQKKWLEASLAARQFALLYPDHPQSSEFAKLADDALEHYRNQVRQKVRGNAIANAITGALGFVLTGNLFGPFTAIDSTVMLLRGESAVGGSIANHVKRQVPVMEDEAVLNYVREVGNKVAQVAGRNDFEYEFYVIMDDRLNAFALPGGKVFVNAGAILKTRSEAELAGLLAHELSHAVLSHGFQLATQGNLIANVTQYIPLGGTAADLIVLNYSRDMERQADALGTRILASSGYAADGLHNLMITLDKEERDRPIFAWLSTHPNTGERIRNIETLIQRNGYNRYTYEGVSRHIEIQKRVAQLLKEYKEREKKEK